MKPLLAWAGSIWGHGQSTHATHSVADWLLVGLAVCTVGYAFYQAVRHTLYPGETSADHVKRRILDDEEARR